MNSRRTTALALTAADDLINSQESFSVKQKVSCKYHQLARLPSMCATKNSCKHESQSQIITRRFIIVASQVKPSCSDHLIHFTSRLLPKSFSMNH
jgi:hypothetical protein